MTTPALFVAIGAVAGLIAGSFVGAIVLRWPRDRSVVGGRSRCDACQTKLRARDLVPLLSFVMLRGRCAACAAPIARDHLVAEIGCALVGATAFAVAPPVSAAAGSLFGWGLVALALLDARHYWLPDRLTVPLAAFGIAASASRLGPPPVDSLIGAAAGFVSLFLVGRAYHAVRGRVGLGGGDPKLFGAIGAWLGWAPLPFVLLLASTAGLASLLGRRARGEAVTSTDRLPLGALLAIAAWPMWLIAAGGLAF